MPRGIDFYFDFISPYSYLAVRLVEERPVLATRLEYKPVVFGTMLARRNVLGPGEIPIRRRRGLEDVVLLAAHYGIPLEGPPSHPFNSIYALRAVCATDASKRGALVSSCFRAAWERGESLEDLTVLRRCLSAVGDGRDPEELATDRAHRAALKENTNEALERGAIGVPTFAVDDLLFFGHDRLDLLSAYVDGSVALDRSKVERMLARPQPGRIV